MTQEYNLQPLTEEEHEKIREKKREYNRNYYRKNKQRINEKNKKWRDENPEKTKAAIERHWRKKAGVKV